MQWWGYEPLTPHRVRKCTHKEITLTEAPSAQFRRRNDLYIVSSGALNSTHSLRPHKTIGYVATSNITGESIIYFYIIRLSVARVIT